MPAPERTPFCIASLKGLRAALLPPPLALVAAGLVTWPASIWPWEPWVRPILFNSPKAGAPPTRPLGDILWKRVCFIEAVPALMVKPNCTFYWSEAAAFAPAIMTESLTLVFVSTVSSWDALRWSFKLLGFPPGWDLLDWPCFWEAAAFWMGFSWRLI